MYNTKNIDDETVEYEFANQLPHGSGIDCSWEFHQKGNYVYFTNSYHTMNDNGYYEGYQDFRIRIDVTVWNLFVDSVQKKQRYQHVPSQVQQMERMIVLRDIIAEKFELQFIGGNYLATKHMLRDYLEETISCDITRMAF